MTEYKKKLIEVALPLDAINAASAREKSIRHGHPSTLHLWWARRPLAACRAVLFAQLVDDPSAHPEEFPTEDEQDRERERLFRIIEDLVLWENTTNEEVLERARAEIRRSCGGNPPAILDPFAGGGSIPLEAQRLGLEAHASDLNPVAVLINKALIEIPPKWADQPPVHPAAQKKLRWKGAEGLAEDVRRYGEWLRDEAESRIGHLYPKAKLPDGGEAQVVAWIWARTIECANPGCGATMPLVRSFWLSKGRGRNVWLEPQVVKKAVTFQVVEAGSGPGLDRTVQRAGATCLVCSNVSPLSYVRATAQAQGMGTQGMAVVAKVGKSRVYLPAGVADLTGFVVPPVGDIPAQVVPSPSHDVDRMPMYGMHRWADAFTSRQLIYLNTVTELLDEVRARISADAKESDRPSTEYSAAIVTYLGLALSRLIDQLNSLARWSPGRDQSVGLFARHAIPMVWDFPEVNPFAGAAGDLGVGLKNLVRLISSLPANGTASVAQVDARKTETRAVVTTDPPYYDNIGYADLSDFFYVWLRRFLRATYPELTNTIVVPKSSELIASPGRHDGSIARAAEFFERGFVDVFSQLAQIHPPHFPLTLFYAFKQAESMDGETASTGWSTMLEGLMAAGWVVTSTWPLRTERSARTLAIKTNALASSVVLTCRLRQTETSITDRSGFIRALTAGLQGPIRGMQSANISPVDLRQAALGPGMSTFSRFAKVIEPDGSFMRVHTALGLINQVLDQVLDEQTANFDPETRWATLWFGSNYFDVGPYGAAEQLAVSMNIAVRSMVQNGMLESGGGHVRLLNLNDLPDAWSPATGGRTPVWEATHHLVKRLAEHSESAAGQLLRELGGVGDSARQLAYRLYTICEKPKPALAMPYNALVASWPEIQRLAREAPGPAAPQQQSFDA